VSFSINTNIASLQAQQSLQKTQSFLNQTIGEVTSGLRIVNSGDDAAGLAIANNYRSTESVLTQGIRNANDGLSQLQVADGGISNISQLLDRARTLATQSASGAFTGDRNVLNAEFKSVLQEIDRQAESIGLNAGGTFAKNLSVLIGGGQASNGITATQNGSVDIDLSRSTVDTASLGLSGVQASGQAGTDIGSGSANTSLASVLANSTNTASESVPGFSTFYLKGPGFSGSGIAISVNLSNLGSTADLSAAVNNAIQTAQGAGTQQATALKNANVIASINTDATGKQQLTFSSSTAAFQIQAGDRMANALLGNFAQNATLVGADSNATVATNGGGSANTLTLSVDGGPTFNVSVTSGASVSKAQIVKDLNNDTGAGLHFANYATATLQGDQIVLQSKNGGSNSSVAIGSTTLSTNLGLSTTPVTAANASTGASLNTYVMAASNSAVSGTTVGTAGAGTVTFRFQGAGLTSPADITVATSANETIDQAISALNNAVSNDANLKAVGINLTTATAGDGLTFTSTKGQAFNLQVTGDTQNLFGFGSFINGANNAVDYASLTGSNFSVGNSYNNATAVGTTTFEISIGGQASNMHSIAVNLADGSSNAGDATAASVTGTAVAGGTVSAITNNNRYLSLAVNGTITDVTLNTGTNVALSSIANQINSAVGSNVATVVNNALQFTSTTAGAGSSVQVLTTNSDLGLTAGAGVNGTSRSGSNIAAYLNQKFSQDTTLQAAGLKANYAAGQLTVTSANGTYFRLNAMGSGAVAGNTIVGVAPGNATFVANATSGTAVGGSALGASTTITAASNDSLKIQVDGGTATTITLAAGTYTRQQVADMLNTEFISNGIGATASINSANKVVITSNSTGTSSAVALTAAASHDARANLGLTSDVETAGVAANSSVTTGGNVLYTVNGGSVQTATLGATSTLANIASAFGASGISVTSDAQGFVKFATAATGTGASVGFTTGAGNANLGITNNSTVTGHLADTGFGASGASFAGNVSSAAPANTAQIDVGGASETSDFNFTPMMYGSDQQTVTITAPDTNGAQESLSVTLQNNASVRNGVNIDQAVSSINTALQQSNNATLQQIVAVKDNSSGTEQIKFMSTLNNFQVSVGNTADGSGMSAGGAQGITVNSARAAGGSTADISSLASAQAAVNALANSVTVLGSAQAVVGRGENQFHYAINLANSQLTNFSAAESTIRDADLATESANLTKSQILLQAGIAALAQANSAPQQVLSLLQH
jgi:flagellin